MLKAVEDKVIIETIKEELVSASGLVLGQSNEVPDTGIVVGVGPGLLLGNGQMMIPEVEVGQKVLFSKYNGSDVEHEGKTYKILQYRDILAILD